MKKYHLSARPTLAGAGLGSPPQSRLEKRINMAKYGEGEGRETIYIFCCRKEFYKLDLAIEFWPCLFIWILYVVNCHIFQ